MILPDVICRIKLKDKIKTIESYDTSYIKNRVDYYCKLQELSQISSGIELGSFKVGKRQKDYFFDTYEYTRYFDKKLLISYKFGDVTIIPDTPTIVKSRPIEGDNANSVVLKLDKNRHFTFVNDNKHFRDKKNMLIGRNVVGKTRQEHRFKFLEKYINHPMCNIGMINKRDDRLHLYKDKITIDEHLNYKFVLCLEGNDVATNLKWVMSSNSLAITPELVYETWFMEGTLIPDFHFVKIKNDYSDLQEKMEYYINYPDKALEIIKNANTYVEQFKNKKREDLISLMVLEKYFYKTGQKNS
jgi:hypothetical protein